MKGIKMPIQNRHTDSAFISEDKEGCLIWHNKKLFRIKKVKTLNWNAIVVLADVYHPWKIKVVKMSRVECHSIYYPMHR